jgi:hypothetical protein
MGHTSHRPTALSAATLRFAQQDEQCHSTVVPGVLFLVARQQYGRPIRMWALFVSGALTPQSTQRGRSSIGCRRYVLEGAAVEKGHVEAPKSGLAAPRATRYDDGSLSVALKYLPVFASKNERVEHGRCPLRWLRALTSCERGCTVCISTTAPDSHIRRAAG